MSKKLVILGAGVALAAATGGGGYYFWLRGAAAAVTESEQEAVGVLDLKPFVTNVSDAGGRRHARVEIKLTVSPPERAEELAADSIAMARLQDRVLTALAAKTAAELTTPEGKATLRNEILAGAAPIVEPGAVKEALFSEFVVQ